MQRLLEILLGIDRAPWADGGDWHVQFLSAPRHGWLLVMLLAVPLAAWGVLYLYRLEGRNLSLPVRVMLGTLRMVVLLGVVAMLLEPVLVFTKQEFVPSNLIVLTDRSSSMDLKDAYADAGTAERLTKALKLTNADELRDQTRGELATRLLDAGLRDKLAANGERIVRESGFTSQLIPDNVKVADASLPPRGVGVPPASAPSTQNAGETPTPRGGNGAGAIDRSTTALGTAIRQAIAAHRGQPVAGVLVLTDGQSNAGEPPAKAAEFAAAEGIPVVAVATGTPEGPRNAKITKLENSPVAFVRDPNPVRVVIESRGMAKADAAVILERSRDGGPWEEVARQQITLAESGLVQEVPFEIKEDRPSRLSLRARIDDAGVELTRDDNVASGEMRVIRQKIRVLFVAGSTFPEVEFIRNALLRDAGISASTWLQTADAQYDQAGNPPIKRLPTNDAEMNEFDCVVLYDPDPTLWAANFPELLADFVAKAGGGMIYVAGERMTKTLFDGTVADDPGKAWVRMLPVFSEPGLYRSEVSMRLSSQSPWRLDITSEGKADPIFKFDPAAEKNEPILASLPGMFWHFPVTRAKPGATVLARHGDPRMRNEHGPHVLLATQLVGPGRTIFVGFDSTYRWRYLSEQYFDGFWARMIDRAGRGKQLGGRYPYTLTMDRADYRPGTQATLTARFENPQDAGAGIDSLSGEVEVGDKSTPVTLTARSGERGVFEATFPVAQAGPHFVRVWTGDESAKTNAKPATLQFDVALPNLEYERPGTDLATLQQVTGLTKGAVFDPSQVDQIAAAFRVKQVARVLEDRQEIWHAPLIFGTILFALIAEWVLRKKYRMV